MSFEYHEGERVALRYDHTISGLKSGAEGVIWSLYNLGPPAYEVTFTDSIGSQFDALMYEEELTAICELTETNSGNNVPNQEGS